MQIERIDHFVLTVRDIAATCDFYTRVLGMEVVTFAPGRLALRFGQQKINLHEVGHLPDRVAQAPTPGAMDFCLITRTPVSQVIEHLRACGVEIVAGPVERSGALGPIQSVYIRDPDGNLVEISNDAREVA
jgi:catechol 2,3-dioxygenase-like lactoylglutathione lyase family enzyme